MLEHEHSLRDELDPAWALRPVALTTLEGRLALVLEDPGGEPLLPLIGTPMDVTDRPSRWGGYGRRAAPAARPRPHSQGLIDHDADE
jgi:hypothetical protein